jgi:hypothetical protein
VLHFRKVFGESINAVLVLAQVAIIFLRFAGGEPSLSGSRTVDYLLILIALCGLSMSIGISSTSSGQRYAAELIRRYAFVSLAVLASVSLLGLDWREVAKSSYAGFLAVAFLTPIALLRISQQPPDATWPLGSCLAVIGSIGLGLLPYLLKKANAGEVDQVVVHWMAAAFCFGLPLTLSTPIALRSGLRQRFSVRMFHRITFLAVISALAAMD